MIIKHCPDCQQDFNNGRKTETHYRGVLQLAGLIQDELCADCLAERQRVERINLYYEACSCNLDTSEIFG